LKTSERHPGEDVVSVQDGTQKSGIPQAGIYHDQG